MKTSISRDKSINNSKIKSMNYSNISLKKPNKNLPKSNTLKKDLKSPKTIDYTKSQSIKILIFLVIEKYGKIIDRLTTEKSEQITDEDDDREYELKLVKSHKKNSEYDKQSIFNSSKVFRKDLSNKR